jgi:hypothetical protein
MNLFCQTRNPRPGPSGDDDLDASGLLAAQIEDENDNDEPHHDLDMIDNQVGFLPIITRAAY